jgi:hypothetical protein
MYQIIDDDITTDSKSGNKTATATTTSKQNTNKTIYKE